MHDIRLIRAEPDAFDAALARRGMPPRAAEILALDETRRAAQTALQDKQARRNALSIRWLIQAARARGEKSMEEKLANEILDAAAGRGTAVKKREDVHRMAEANKAFAHYRW